MRAEPDMMCFDVERALAKALGMRCETYVCGPQVWRIRLGQRWTLEVDRDQLEELWQDCDQPSTIKAVFDKLKVDCLAYLSVNR